MLKFDALLDKIKVGQIVTFTFDVDAWDCTNLDSLLASFFKSKPSTIDAKLLSPVGVDDELLTVLAQDCDEDATNNALGAVVAEFYSIAHKSGYNKGSIITVKAIKSMYNTLIILKK